MRDTNAPMSDPSGEVRCATSVDCADTHWLAALKGLNPATRKMASATVVPDLPLGGSPRTGPARRFSKLRGPRASSLRPVLGLFYGDLSDVRKSLSAACAFNGFDRDFLHLLFPLGQLLFGRGNLRLLQSLQPVPPIKPVARICQQPLHNDLWLPLPFPVKNRKMTTWSFCLSKWKNPAEFSYLP